MSLTDALKKGMVLQHEGKLYVVLDFWVAQTGKMKPSAHVKLRPLTGGQATEKTLDQLGKLEEVNTDVRPMQYLYSGGGKWVFMDNETFEQYELGEDLLGSAVDFLVEQESYSFLTAENEILELRLPAHLALEVVDTAPSEHAGGSTSVQKEARLNSGLTIQVPLFIKNGDKIKVSTETREYLGKEH